VRRVIVQDDLREAQIRPDSGFNTYIELLERDLKEFLADAVLVDLLECPACGHPDAAPDFEKMGIRYKKCANCRTSYASPRPNMEALDQFYAESEAIQYWNSSVAQRTASARRQYIFGPRATWVIETAGVYQQEDGFLVDFYTKYPAYLEEVAVRGAFTKILIRKPAVAVDDLLTSGIFRLVDSIDEETASVVSAFEVVDRMIQSAANLEILPSLKKIVVAGHSAGNTSTATPPGP